MSVPTSDHVRQLQAIFGKQWRYTIWEKLNEWQSEVKCRKSVASKWGQTVIPAYWQSVLARHTKFVMDDWLTEADVAQSLRFIKSRNKTPGRNRNPLKGYRENAVELEQRRAYQTFTRAFCGEKAARRAASEPAARYAG